MKLNDQLRVIGDLLSEVERGFETFDILQNKQVFVVCSILHFCGDMDMTNPVSGSLKASANFPCKNCLIEKSDLCNPFLKKAKKSTEFVRIIRNIYTEGSIFLKF